MHVLTSGVTASATYSQRVINNYIARIVFVQGHTLIFRTWRLWRAARTREVGSPPRHCVGFIPHSQTTCRGGGGGGLAQHPDDQFWRYILGGIERGFRIGFDHSRPLVSARRNLPSASNQPAATSARRCKPEESWACSPEARSTGSTSIAWG